MKAFFPALILTLLAPLASAYEVRLSEQQLQQELDARMPLVQQQGMFTLELNNPQLTLINGEQRLSIRTDALLSTTFGLRSKGKVMLDGKVRYEKSDYSFYIDDPKIRQLSIEGVPPGMEPQLIELAQQALEPSLRGQPVYTLSDQEITESMARMMLKSMTIKDKAVVLDLTF